MAADDDGEVFEITDFTTASDWERFISRVEEILHEWKLVSSTPKYPAPKGSYTSGTWEEQSAELNFADFAFTLTHIWLKSDDDHSEKAPEKETAEEEAEEDDDIEQTATVHCDLMNMENDFPSRAHCICRWYGVQEFVILCPAQTSDAILSESKTKLLLSSVNIALSDAGCPVPVFVQVQQKWRKLYQGTSVLPGSSVEFGMVHLKRTPSQFSHLAGLLDVFKAKLGAISEPRPPVSVAVRFLYVLYDWVNSPWTQPLPDIEDEVGCVGFQQLPFGACEDPVSALNLYCTWPSLSEDMIVENHAYSDLDPLQAPQWSVRIQMTEDPQCLLGDYLCSFIALCHRKETLDQLIGNFTSDISDTDQSADISQALHRLTEPAVSYSMPSFSSYVAGGQGTKPKVKTTDAPVPSEMMDSILQYLFPDAKTIETSDKEGKKEPEDKSIPDLKDNPLAKELSRQLKSAPVSGLLYKMAVCMCILNHDRGGLYSVGHLWQEFVMEMRYRWENNYLIEGVEKGPPNLGACILQQKLQMLNCCIEKKIKREQLHKGYTGQEIDDDSNNQSGPSPGGATASASLGSLKDNPGKPLSLDSSSDDEFFECAQSDDEKTIEQENQSKHGQTENQSKDKTDRNQSDRKEGNQSDEKDMDTEERTETADQSAADESGHESDMDCDPNVSPSEEQTSGRASIDSSTVNETLYQETFTHKPEGRMAPIADLKLVNCIEQLYIPMTQEPAPMTEDMLEEHAEVLSQLGTSAEGAELRARMQSACLLSDMESFKAANPGGVLEDFVRWYSPRDWIEEAVLDENNKLVSKGRLSPRMLIPGNMWVEVWQTARPVPARRQKRLFDDTKEAEKVLHFLSALRPADVVVNLLPMLIHAALLKALENDDAKIPVLKQVIEQACTKASLVTRSPQQDAKRYEELVRIILQAEIIIARNQSLKLKFTEDLLDRSDALEELQHFVTCILQNSEVTVRGGPQGPAGVAIHKLFVASQRASYMVLDEDIEEPEQKEDLTKHNSSVPCFPRPIAREYILRTIVPRPAPYSQPLPHRLFCSIEEEEFRVAGAFCSDTVFQ